MRQEPQTDFGEQLARAEFACQCRPEFRSACKGLALFKDYENKRYCVLHYPARDKVEDFNAVSNAKLSGGDFDFAGVWFTGPVNLNGFDFTTGANFSQAVFEGDAYFGTARFSAAANFFGATFKSIADFSGATFSAPANFHSATFRGAAVFYETKFRVVAYFRSATFGNDAYFASATFKAANFFEVGFGGSVYFSSTTFADVAHFDGAVFSGYTDFRSATFAAAGDFNGVVFRGNVDFRYVTFSADADFRSASFRGEANFDSGSLNGYVRFAGREHNVSFTPESALSLQRARITSPECISFHSVLLRPHWFVNIDARKFEFINIDWQHRRMTKWSWVPFQAPFSIEVRRPGFAVGITQEIRALEEREIASPHRLLSIACRNLAVNAEDNNRYDEASMFRYISMDAERRGRARGLAVWSLDWWYWLASGYGERWHFAAGWLLAIVFLVFPILYAQVGFESPKPGVAAVEQSGAATTNDPQPAPFPQESVAAPHGLPLARAATQTNSLRYLCAARSRCSVVAKRAAVASLSLIPLGKLEMHWIFARAEIAAIEKTRSLKK